MGVATHLGIKLSDYDARIRTFIPDYEEMLDVAADAVPPATRSIVDIGTGTGALAARCAAHAPSAHVTGIDADGAILSMAARRLGPRATLVVDSFLRAPIPSCDVIVSSFALHHVRTRPAKARLYRRFQRALRRAGRVITVDCQPSPDRRTARAQFDAWRKHLRRSYSRQGAQRLLDAWSHEDVYVPIDAECALLSGVGLSVDVLWRKGAFAVLVATRR